MKADMQPSFQYSAYPLKAIEQAVIAAKNGDPSPKLRALLSSQETPAKARLRVHPMVTSYKNLMKAMRPRVKRPKDVEPEGKDWFRNYE
jgi:hypothetical protein